MTYDELLELTGYYPAITINQWDAMNADERLMWLAKEVNRREGQWKKTLGAIGRRRPDANALAQFANQPVTIEIKAMIAAAAVVFLFLLLIVSVIKVGCR